MFVGYWLLSGDSTHTHTSDYKNIPWHLHWWSYEGSSVPWNQISRITGICKYALKQCLTTRGLRRNTNLRGCDVFNRRAKHDNIYLPEKGWFFFFLYVCSLRLPSKKALRLICTAAPCASSKKYVNFPDALFRATNHILDGVRLVTWHPGNKENGAEACSGSVCLSWALSDRNNHKRQKGAYVRAEQLDTDCRWWMSCFSHHTVVSLLFCVVNPLSTLCWVSYSSHKPCQLCGFTH